MRKRNPSLKEAASFALRTNYDQHQYLRLVYKTVYQWDQQKRKRKNAREIYKKLGLGLRKDTTAFRALIEQTCPEAEPKQKSRWSRALDWALYNGVIPDRLVLFLFQNGGVAGCARKMAERKPKHKFKRDDWAVGHLKKNIQEDF